MAILENDNPIWYDSAITQFEPLLDRADAAFLGTDAIRAGGNKYLAQYESETHDRYKNRVNASTFYSAYAETLNGAAGIVFQKPMTLMATGEEAVPEKIRGWWDNIDLKGTHGDVFAQRVFLSGLHTGWSCIFVDKPRIPEGLSVDETTVRSLKIRPYWRRYTLRDLHSWPVYIPINGVPTLQEIVFRESVASPAANRGVVYKTRYKVWRLPVEQDLAGNWFRAGNVEWEEWEDTERVNDATRQVVTVPNMLAGGVTNLVDIPVAVFNANPDPYDDLWCNGPALNDLILLNIKHYQILSDQEEVLRWCKPSPYTVNLDPKSRELVAKEWRLGMMLHCSQNGLFAYAEPKGTGLEQRKEHLEAVKREMLDIGLSLVVGERGTSGDQTATEQVMKSRAKSSKLSTIARSFQDCIEMALYHTALQSGLEKGGRVTLGVREADLIVTSQTMVALNTLVQEHNLPLRVAWDIMKRGGLMPDGFNAEEYLKQIVEEHRMLASVRESESQAAVAQRQGQRPAIRASQTVDSANS